MMMQTLIVSILLVLIIGGAVCYIWKKKKSGVKCIGCPDGASCSGRCTECAGCSAKKEE